MIPRELNESLHQMAEWLPIVSVTGPRQSGKSTLVRAAFPDYEYLNLERPDLRAAALEDPVGFIASRPDRLIIDEAQYAPELFSMIQVASDERGTSGQYVLSGSQNFLLLRQIQQSLAGRVGMLHLLPLSFAEASSPEASSGLSVDEFMLRGGYPRLYASSIGARAFFESYLETYIERDVGGYLDVRDLASFRTFLRLCAQRVGSLVNLSSLASDAGVSFRTAKSWLSILESSHVVVRLMPYHANPGKRLTKTPKLYFVDTGLLSYLLGIRSLDPMLLGPHLGAVFENLVVSEAAKRHLNQGVTPELYFYRDDGKREVDLLDWTEPGDERLVEIKSGQTFRPAWGKTLVALGEELGVPPERRAVVYRGSETLASAGFRAVSAAAWLRGA